VKLLLHACCGPCALLPIRTLREAGHTVTLLFYNPNIHPFMEFRKRLRAVELVGEREHVDVIEEDRYGLDEFLDRVGRGEGRCRRCYELRLSRTFRTAAERGFESATTTLLTSPQQDHECIRSMSEKLAEQYRVQFVYLDLRQRHREAQELARKYSLYRQQYCGCIFSEYERYRTVERGAEEGDR